MDPHRGILINRIPVDGLGGVIFVLGMMALILIAMPTLRPVVGLCLIGGVLLAPILRRLGH
jgi:hypothetical protein